MCVSMLVYVYVYICNCIYIYQLFLSSLESLVYSMDMNLNKLWEIVKDRGARYTAVHGVTKSLV